MVSKLAKFADGPKPTARAPSATKPTKGTGKAIGITVRFDPDDWQRMSEYAIRKRTSLQALALEGCSRILEDEGLKPLKVVAAAR